jgi:tryptophan synthase alpha chain
MTTVKARMKEVLSRGEKVLVSGVPVGYPDLDATRRVVEIYIRSGIDLVEFSMPSLIPYIDTKIIAESNIKALELEPELNKHLQLLAKIREDFPDEPFYMMAYADFIRKLGMERFVTSIREIGVESLELPDKEEKDPELWRKLDVSLEKAGIYRTYIFHHPFNRQFLDQVKNKTQGFVLLQSFADDQGKRPRVAPENKNIIAAMREAGLAVPIILGYGINNPERVKEAAQVGADGVIVGTAMIERLNKGDYDGLSSFIRDLKTATRPTK